MEGLEAGLKVAGSNASFLAVGLDQYHIHHAHWTTEWTAPNAFPVSDHLILTKLPKTATRDKLLHILPQILSDSVGRMHIYPDDHMAVVSILDPSLLKNYLKEHQSIELENSASVLLFPAYLLVALPKSIEDDSYSMSRYSDKGKTKICFICYVIN